jgi:hypothetical protein
LRIKFSFFLDRHSTPFNRISKQVENGIFLVKLFFIYSNIYLETRSPFTQSLFEPVNLLRTVATDNDDFIFFPPSFSFENQNFSLFQQSNSTSMNKQSELANLPYHQPLPYFNHLLPPRTTPIDTNLSAFKPIEPANTRPTTSFELKRPQVVSSSTGTNWFGQS